ncbi:hypothetical protein [Streptomyces sp. Je 1-369]|uniref:hypothetical protein n=1 Tax=Streptomyces sp. Je 1-369 TaxID=2966192 RepID=UPI002285A3D4|nr:hypothetical protein [Streptomyces sp. Je 1-369]WAL93969.1 hypothetical protein NOO62_05320 [Streptomyces sp. Je 1-369]
MERTDHSTPQPSLGTVLNLDSYGSTWGTSTLQETEADIAEARAAGTAIDEWTIADRDDQPLRIVRLADPTFLDTIHVIPAQVSTAVPA